MADAIIGIMIGIGVVLLLLFQGMMLVSLNNKSDQIENQRTPHDRKSIIAVIKNLKPVIFKRHH
jgi:hypothetical protein